MLICNIKKNIVRHARNTDVEIDKTENLLSAEAQKAKSRDRSFYNQI